VVVVEDTSLPAFSMPRARRSLFRLLEVPGQPDLALPVAFWMDPTKVISGGNTVAQVYPLGWGY
jgi:hypothetical protein